MIKPPRLSMIETPSVNFDERGTPVSILVLHYTGMRNAGEALARLRDPAAKVSAHYMIGEDGSIWHLVKESKRAWHAGASSWRGITDVNAASIGIELVNPGPEFGYHAFPPAQMEALAALAKGILGRHAILPRDVIGHSDIAPLRKQDPGELFNWKWLAEQGIGLFPSVIPAKAGIHVGPGLRRDDIYTIQSRLAQYGYGLQTTGELDEATQAVITAFQRHFRPSRVDGAWDGECEGLLAGLLALV